MSPGDRGHYRLLTGVSLKLEDGVSVDLEEFCVYGSGDFSDSDGGRHYALEKATSKDSGIWKMMGCIDLPASMDEITVEVKMKGGEGVGRMRLEFSTDGPWVNSLDRHYREISRETVAENGMRITISFTEDTLVIGEMANLLAKLSGMSYSRFNKTGQTSEIHETISLARRALEMTPDDHPDRAQRLGDLGASSFVLFKRLGRLANLDEAISLQQRVLEITPEGHPNRSMRVANLGTFFHTRFRRLGHLDDLNEAISLQQTVIEMTADDHPSLSLRMANLGTSFHARFERTGELADVDEAISWQKKALNITPDQHPDRALRLANLGNSCRARLELKGEMDDLNEAILLHQKALEMVPGDHPNRALWLGNLGVSFHARYEHSGALTDLDQAILMTQKALELTPDDHPDRDRRLGSLAISFFARFERTGVLLDIDEAIALGQRALEVTPEGHPKRAYRLHTLALSHLAKGRSLHGSPNDILTSISHLKLAAAAVSGPYSTRFKAARSWARTLRQHCPDSPDVLPAFETTLSLSALVAGLDRTVTHRYTTLKEVSGVAVEACSAALSRGRADKALEWLEHGRCLVWGQLNQLRAPINQLRTRDPALADRIAMISQQLDAAGSSRIHSQHGKSLPEKILLEKEARAHQELANERDELVAKARKLPGFETFLTALSYASLLGDIPSSGYVIVINGHHARCDAIVLSAQRKEPLHIPLTTFSLQQAQHYRTALKESYEHRGLRMRDSDVRGARLVRRDRENSMVALLKGLWTGVVKPIFDALELERIHPLSSSGKTYPRIWWCPTGVLSFLPLHAAGVYHDAKGSVGALDYAISSYTPTVTSLINRVKNSRPVSGGVAGLLLTSQPSPKVLNVPSIPGTTKEVDSVYARACEGKVRAARFEGDEVGLEAYLEHMESFSSVHLACHGSQNAADPLSSRFLFHSGSLELRSIMKKDLNNGDLAFLSACQTSTGEEKLADEAVHLAAGMLAAGYRRVVATMWPISDNEAPQVAQDFYDYIFDRREEGDVGGFDGSLSAEALHYAVMRLRDRLGNSERALLTWAPYVHWGY